MVRNPAPTTLPGAPHERLQSYLNFFFTVYPPLPRGVLDGQPARFDRDQYTWKSDSSQLLRSGQLRWGSNLFHGGILFLFFGHLFGQLTPALGCTETVITASQTAARRRRRRRGWGLCFVGLTMLLHRRIFDPRIRLTSHRTDIAILVILWVQLVIGLSTLPTSLHHVAEPTMLRLAEYLGHGASRLHPNAALVAGVDWHFQVHGAGHDDLPAVPVQPPGALVGGFATVTYLFRPPQVAQPTPERASRPQPPPRQPG